MVDTDNLVDLFCGAGGSGGGLLEANEILDRKVKGTFVNHSGKAIEIHQLNHPEHRHLKEDLFTLDPTSVLPAGTPCSLLWASPQCTHFSVARGGACVDAQARSHADSVVAWVRHVRPECVIVENVKEFLTYGPVKQQTHDNGELVWRRGSRPMSWLPTQHARQRDESVADWCVRMQSEGYLPYIVPDKSRSGEYFNRWVGEIESLGYRHEYRMLCSADYGDPTVRKRLFVYFVRCDTGKDIVWPTPYAGKDRPMRCRTARDIIDWSDTGRSIFNRKKNLSDATLRRLAIGMVKYGAGSSGAGTSYAVPHRAELVKRWDKPVYAPVRLRSNVRLDVHTDSMGRSDPSIGTTEQQRVLYKIFTDANEESKLRRKFTAYINAEIVNIGNPTLSPWIYVYYSHGSEGKGIDEPLSTVTTMAKHALVYPVLEPDGQTIRLDIRYRMLTTLELQRSMGFPDHVNWGEKTTKAEIIKAVGNSVSVGLSRALGLSWYTQESNVWEKVRHIYKDYESMDEGK